MLDVGGSLVRRGGDGGWEKRISLSKPARRGAVEASFACAKHGAHVPVNIGDCVAFRACAPTGGLGGELAGGIEEKGGFPGNQSARSRTDWFIPRNAPQGDGFRQFRPPGIPHLVLRVK